MLEPINNKKAETNNSTSTTPTKPVEIIQQDLFDLKPNEVSSYSAYASAESSPTQGNSLINKTQENRTKSATSSSSSLSSYLTIENTSKLMDDFLLSGRVETPISNTTKTSNDQLKTPTESFYDDDQANRNYLEDEFLSLPCHYPDDFILQQQAKKSSNQEIVSSLINKEIESQLNDFKAQPLSSPSTTQSKSSIKSAIGCFFEKVLFGSNDKSSSAAVIEPSASSKTSPDQSKSKKFLETNNKLQTSDLNVPKTSATTSNGIASASSPNPDCSPYKLLLNEVPSNKNIVINDFNSRNTDKIVQSLEEDQKYRESSIKNSDKPNNLIESLACLNRKESDKIDPILSQLVNSKTINDKTEVKTATSAAENDVLKTTLSNEASTKVDHVPASSHEFCMDLNFNLAAAAAATAAGPVVVSALPAAPSQSNSIDHNRFTSNASTSSIHNDLKMILEESKEKQQQKHKGICDSPTQKSKTNKLQAPPPKPQRVPAGRTKSASSSDNNNKKIIESETNNLNLIKTLMSMVEQNKKNNKQQQQDKPVINWPKKENGRYRYTKEFLNQINEQRSEFIDQIYPEIFRVYCSCMKGKYWDPEQYFDIIQFPDEFDRSKNNNSRSMNNSRSYNNSTSFNQNYNQKSNRKRNTSSTSNSNKYDNTKSKYQQSDLIIQSPQPLQVPKNSPKDQPNHKNNLNSSATSSKNGKENRRKFNNILSTLGLEQSFKSNHADKILLDLIKNNASNDKNNNNLLDMLNSKKEQFDKRSSTNIFDTLLMNNGTTCTQPSTSNKHFPLVLTAQELEMSQMLTQQKNSRHKLPINQNEISNEFETSNNTSDAYKQLVQNLKNHPLNSPALTGVPPTVTNKQSPNWPVSNNGTNVLKQLLNLQITEQIAKPEPKKNKKKSNHHHHHHHGHNTSKTKSPSSSMLAESNNKFPAINPHEKPFENYLNEDSTSKQVEIVVASTLNHVLDTNKSPTNVIENLFEKMESKKKSANSESDHFYSLLNKMMPVIDTSIRQKAKQAESSSDILKWFSGDINKSTSSTLPVAASTKFSPTVLSEIEFMEMQRPQVLNKLY